LNATRDRILKGEDFGKVAMLVSDDAQTRSKGGDLGVIEVEQLSAEMKLVQQELKVGEISKPFKLPLERDYAYAIVQLVNRIPAHRPTLETDYQRIVSYAKIVKQNKEYVHWLDGIRANVYWKIYR
jgi:peptidyl-prolyl cis-trans isomerase SurA